ncbi:MAG: cyclodeaminase/cyclohydrolase family protein [Chloroflexi bacterium]|nr:cyclodeaminase/cyclohydrolase family protein [Chloroflexota bacterium]
MAEGAACATIEGFAAALASNSPTPGGGSAAAAAVALGAALVGMSAQLTLARKRFKSVHAEMERIVARTDAIRAEALALIEADSDAYAGLLAAYRLPRAPEAARVEAIATAALAASRVPAAVGELALDVIELAGAAVAKANPHVRCDAAAGAALARGAMRICEMNIAANIGSVADEAARVELERSCERFRSGLARADAAAERVLSELHA